MLALGALSCLAAVTLGFTPLSLPRAPRHPAARLSRRAATVQSPPSEAALPEHPDLVTGVLPNGLQYTILPNRSPPQRFEAHLEVFAGSSDELDAQQGMAHLVEHVAYMGSRKRERLFGTGSQTNAYTDFHHTVFYACCPTDAPAQPSIAGFPIGSTRMLPRALDALCEVLEARFEPSRIEKERAAVLSEMSMVNTIEYRVECQILSALHKENMLARRFPIGQEELIRAWTGDDVKAYHAAHYSPANAQLYVIGDLDTAEAVQTIAKVFGHLKAPKLAGETPGGAAGALAAAAALSGRPTLKLQSPHFPPVLHTWCGSSESTKCSVATLSAAARKSLPDLKLLGADLTPQFPLDEKYNVQLFHHELLQSFSFHLFAKRPVESITTYAAFRESVARRVVLAALQVRLSVQSRNAPLFNFIEFNVLDSPREACAVCSLDLTADATRWRAAVVTAVTQVKKLGVFGLSETELRRYGMAILSDASQLAAQGDQVSHSDQVQALIEAVACEHTFMEAFDSYEVTEQVLGSLTIDEVNGVAKDMCNHLTNFGTDTDEATPPSAIIACVPLPTRVTEDELLEAITEGAAADVEPEVDVVIPPALMSASMVADALAANPPAWAAGSEAAAGEGAACARTGITSRRLGNGLAVNYKAQAFEPQRAWLRLVAPGGRLAEPTDAPGAMAIGARTMQEGGAFGPWTREQVELFCVDHLIMVEITCNEETLTLDFTFPTNQMEGSAVTGTEAVMQILNQILSQFKWEEDALDRAKASFDQQYETVVKSMEGSATEAITKKLHGDERMLTVSTAQLGALTLEQVKAAAQSIMRTDNMEVTSVGDFDVAEFERLSLQYLGSVAAPAPDAAPLSAPPAVPSRDWRGETKHMDMHLEDSDERAVSYVSGQAPNKWGEWADGASLAALLDVHPKKSDAAVQARWKHKGFGAVALTLIQEIVNRRLFSVVRERKQLTYDANFRFTDFERAKGGSYLVTVTSSPENAPAALDACRDTLADLLGAEPITRDNLESARHVTIGKHEAELRTNRYWCEILGGVQLDAAVPRKDMSCVRDYVALAERVSVDDLRLVLGSLECNAENMVTCIATSGVPDGHERVHVAPR